MHVEPFLHFELDFFRRLRGQGYSPSVIYDVGASNGQWSQAVSAIFPGITYQLFEPLAGHYAPYTAPLKATLAANPNFTLHPIALGNTTGTTSIYVSPDGYGSSLLERKMAELVKVDVPCWRLEEYGRAHKLPQPNILKIDVQGFEAFILDGAAGLLPHTDILFLETWLERGYGPNTVLLTELVEALRPADFILVDIGGPYFGELGNLVSVDAFFLSKRLIRELTAAPALFGAALPGS